MPIRVYKVADIIDGEVVLYEARGFNRMDVASLISSLQAPVDPLPESAWKLELIIGKGSGEVRVPIDLPPILSRSHSEKSPVFLIDDTTTTLVYFRDRLFISERPAIRPSERTEISLRVKKAVYDEEAELSSLRAAVANLEAAIEFQKSGPRRDPIPEDVKLLVWARDGGCCVRCRSKQDLHFDHVIPVSKGGGNSDRNIQILCQSCNLKKSARIAIA